MNDKYYCVIDADGFYKDLVLALITQKMDGELVEQIQGYTLAKGESLVLRTDACRQPTPKSCVGAPGFVRARWDGTAWIEGATADEIAAWEAEHPAPEPPGPTAVEQLQEELRLAKAQIKAATDRQDFQDDCIAEMAMQVYNV